jgi:hypothetical protein
VLLERRDYRVLLLHLLRKPCGHFSYLECPADVGRVIDEFFRVHELGR